MAAAGRACAVNGVVWMDGEAKNGSADEWMDGGRNKVISMHAQVWMGA